jgi:hypothetical protein
MMGINTCTNQKQTQQHEHDDMTTRIEQYTCKSNNTHMAITPLRNGISPIRIRHHPLSPLHLHRLTQLPYPGINSRPKPKHPSRHLTPLPNIHIQSRRPRPLHPSRPAPNNRELVRAHPPDIQQHVEDDQRRPGEDGDDAEEDLATISILASGLHPLPLSAVLRGREAYEDPSGPALDVD